MSLSTRFSRAKQIQGLSLVKGVNDSTSVSSGSLSPDDRTRSPQLMRRTKIEKHKTELCKSYSELGSCRYGDKCRFAHGQEELKELPKPSENYRTRPCKGYWEENQCKYGVRCQFGHQKRSWVNVAALAGLKALLQEEGELHSRLLSIIDTAQL